MHFILYLNLVKQDLSHKNRKIGQKLANYKALGCSDDPVLSTSCNLDESTVQCPTITDDHQLMLSTIYTPIIYK